MKLAIYHVLPSGGAKRALYEMVRRLASSHQIDVFTLDCADVHFCDLRKYINQHAVYPFTPQALFNSPFGRLNQVQYWRNLQALMRLERAIAKEICQKDYDLVFVHSSQFTTIPTLIPYLSLPSIYYLHEPFGEAFRRRMSRPANNASRVRNMLNTVDPLPAFYRKSLAISQKKSVQTATRLLANSNFTKQTICAAFNIDSSVCYLGANFSDFKPNPRLVKESFVLSVGELTPRKGFDFIIKSLAQIAPHQRLPFKIACNFVNEQEKRYLQTVARQLDVRLEILESLNTAQLAQLYNKATLLLYAPHSEPFGLVPLEAMACGTPVIAVAEGGIQETVIDGHVGYTTGRNPDEFARMITLLLNDKPLREQLGCQAIKYVRDSWSWDATIDCLEEHFEATLTPFNKEATCP